MAKRDRVPAHKSLGTGNRHRNKNPKLSPYQRELKRNRLANQVPTTVGFAKNAEGKLVSSTLYQRRDEPAHARELMQFFLKQDETEKQRKERKRLADLAKKMDEHSAKEREGDDADEVAVEEGYSIDESECKEHQGEVDGVGHNERLLGSPLGFCRPGKEIKLLCHVALKLSHKQIKQLLTKSEKLKYNAVVEQEKKRSPSKSAVINHIDSPSMLIVAEALKMKGALLPEVVAKSKFLSSLHLDVLLQRAQRSMKKTKTKKKIAAANAAGEESSPAITKNIVTDEETGKEIYTVVKSGNDEFMTSSQHYKDYTVDPEYISHYEMALLHQATDAHVEPSLLVHQRRKERKHAKKNLKRQEENKQKVQAFDRAINEMTSVTAQRKKKKLMKMTKEDRISKELRQGQLKKKAQKGNNHQNGGKQVDIDEKNKKEDDEKLPFERFEDELTAKRSKRVRMNEDEDENDVRLVEKVRFGEQAEAPPLFSEIPNFNSALSKKVLEAEKKLAASSNKKLLSTATRYLPNGDISLYEKKRLTMLGLAGPITEQGVTHASGVLGQRENDNRNAEKISQEFVELRQRVLNNYDASRKVAWQRKKAEEGKTEKDERGRNKMSLGKYSFVDASGAMDDWEH